MKRTSLVWCLLALVGCQSTDAGRVLAPAAVGRIANPASMPATVSLRARLMPPTDPAVPPLEQCGYTGAAVVGRIGDPAYEQNTAVQTIDLQAALTRAGVDNPTIALALEAVRASQAQQLQAHALLLPNLIGGANFDWHEGNLQSGQGIIIDVRRQSIYTGGGAGAIGAGTVAIPGIYLTAHLGDALFEPQAARYRVAGRLLDAEATRNSVLLEVATRFFALAGATARLRAMRQSEADFQEIAKLTADFAKAGQGRESDAQRAQTEVLLIHAAAQGIGEEVDVAAAELARLLDLDPSIHLRTPDGPVPLLELVDPRDELERLVQIAMVNRPEIAARSADVAETETRLRKEKVRPLLPTVAVGFSAGGFGGGGNPGDSGIAKFGGRTDFDASAFWSLQNFGFGNVAVQRQLRAQVSEASAHRAQAADGIGQEVADAFALAAARRHEIDVALRRLQSSQRALQQDLTRARNLQGRPIEVLDSARLLSAARQDHLRAVVGYNQARLQLFVSLGQPP